MKPWLRFDYVPVAVTLKGGLTEDHVHQISHLGKVVHLICLQLRLYGMLALPIVPLERNITSFDHNIVRLRYLDIPPDLL